MGVPGSGGLQVTRYGMLMDVTKCNGCYNCFLACKDEHCGTEHPGYTAAQPMTGQEWVRLVNTERGSFPKIKVDYTAIPCMHCAAAACVKAAAEAGVSDAIYKRADGIVLIDPVKAKGHQELVSSCPYRVIFWNEAEQLPQKCTLCAHLLDEGWKEPRCVEACPTGALLFGDLDDPNSELSKAVAAAGDSTEVLGADPSQLDALGGFGVDTQSLQSLRNMKEGVRYTGLAKTFVAGSVAMKDTDECAVGVTASLQGNGHTLVTVTDGFGDFEFEELRPNSSYTLTIGAPGYKTLERRVETGRSVYLGDLLLER
jgi:Fe-S-cluster-containing dehydrogenase component